MKKRKNALLRILLHENRRNEGKNNPLEYHQDPLMGANVRGQKFEEKYDTYIVSRY